METYLDNSGEVLSNRCDSIKWIFLSSPALPLSKET